MHHNLRFSFGRYEENGGTCCKTYDPGYFESREAISDEGKEELNNGNKFIQQDFHGHQPGRNRKAGRSNEFRTGTNFRAATHNEGKIRGRKTGKGVVVQLKELSENAEIDVLLKMLGSFSCAQAKEIENFLINRAIEFERLSKSRTYLVFDAEGMREKNKTPAIYGYFSLALTILTVPETFSSRKRKELDGFSSKIHGHRINAVPCYLIGQLAKNSSISSNPVAGKDLVDAAINVIGTAEEAVGGRYVMIECHENEKLLQFYHDNSFEELDKVPYAEVPMVQMIRKISFRS